jgi:hypothetical protein
MELVAMAVPAHCEERWRAPQIWLAVVFVVVLDRNVGVATQLARAFGERQLALGERALESAKLGVTFGPAVAVIPTLGLHRVRDAMAVRSPGATAAHDPSPGIPSIRASLEPAI